VPIITINVICHFMGIQVLQTKVYHVSVINKHYISTTLYITRIYMKPFYLGNALLLIKMISQRKNNLAYKTCRATEIREQH